MNGIHPALAVVVLLAAGCSPPEKGPGIIAARGNEPFWAVSIDGRDAVVRTPDLPDGVKYKDGRWASSSGSPTRWVYRARRSNAEGRWLTLDITDQPCTDSMSGNAFPFTATVSYDEFRADGCAG